MSFHLIRPEWLWALIPVALLLWMLFNLQRQPGNWQQLIAKPFQKVLLGQEQQQKSFYLPLMGLASLWLIAIIALTGPSFKKVEQPAEKAQQGVVILLDNSLSMLADDLKPNRITRARYQITDFLTDHPHLSTGLVVYSGSAHVLSPISDDNQTILSLLPTISPTIMPAFGSNALAGINKAIELIQQAKISQGHIIWLLDDIEAHEIPAIKKRLSSTDISLKLLAIGTENGAPIYVPEHGFIKDEQGSIVLAQLPIKNLKNLANAIHSPLYLLGSANFDSSKLAPNRQIANQLSKEEQSEAENKPKTVSHWLDHGAWLLLPLALLVLLSFRRGLIFVWMFLLIPPLAIFSPETFAETSTEDQTVIKEQNKITFIDILKSDDQLGYESWLNKDYETALDRFNSTDWKAASHFRQGNYAKAQQLFSKEETAIAHYNQGNALAKQHKFSEAQKEFEKALSLDPDLKEAQHNLALTQKIIAKQQAEQQNKEQQEASNKKTDKQSEQESKQQEKQDSNKKNESASEGSEGENSQESQETPRESAEDKSSEQKQNQSKPKQTKNDTKNDTENDTESQKTPGVPPQEDETNDKTDEKESIKQDDSIEGEENSVNNIQKSDQALTEQEQAQRAWLNQIPDNPGLFLRRKFEHQYQQQSATGSSPDNNSDKIW